MAKTPCGTLARTTHERMEEAVWRPYFTTADGVVLTTAELYETQEEAHLAGQEILGRPGDFELIDPDGQPVPATEADPGEQFTVEPADEDDF